MHYQDSIHFPRKLFSEKIKDQIELFKEGSFLWQEVLLKTFNQKGLPSYIQEERYMERVVYPLLKEWDYLLKEMYPQMVRHRISSNHMAVFSLSEMNDAELYFVCGLMSYEVFKHSEAESCKKAEEKFGNFLNLKNKKQLNKISPSQIYPNIVDLFTIMLNKEDSSYRIPLCKEYIQYVDNIRKASLLMKEAFMPHLYTSSQETSVIENCFVPNNVNQARYNMLHNMIRIRNSIFVNHKKQHFDSLDICLSLLSKQFYLDQINVLKTLPFNNRDPFLSRRAKISAQILGDVLGEKKYSVKKDFDKHIASCASWLYQMILNNSHLPDTINYENASAFKKAIKDFMNPLYKKKYPSPISYLKKQKERE